MMTEKLECCPDCHCVRFGDAEFCVCGYRWLVAIPKWLGDVPKSYGALHEELFGHFSK